MNNKIIIHRQLAKDFDHHHIELDNYHLKRYFQENSLLIKKKNLRIRSASSSSIFKSAPS